MSRSQRNALLFVGMLQIFSSRYKKKRGQVVTDNSKFSIKLFHLNLSIDGVFFLKKLAFNDNNIHHKQEEIARGSLTMSRQGGEIPLTHHHSLLRLTMGGEREKERKDSCYI